MATDNSNLTLTDSGFEALGLDPVIEAEFAAYPMMKAAMYEGELGTAADILELIRGRVFDPIDDAR